MGIVLVSTTLSLDGFIAGPNHEMDWIFDSQFLPDEPIEAIDRVIHTTGAILTGRNSYEVGQRAQRTETRSAFGGAWSGPEFVLTHHPPDGDDADVSFLSGDITRAVSTALDAAHGKNLLVLGGNVVRQCLDADLVDEMLLMVLPVLLGRGISLFGALGGPPIRFETVAVTQAAQAAILHFRRPR